MWSVPEADGAEPWRGRGKKRLKSMRDDRRMADKREGTRVYKRLQPRKSTYLFQDRAVGSNEHFHGSSHFVRAPTSFERGPLAQIRSHPLRFLCIIVFISSFWGKEKKKSTDQSRQLGAITPEEEEFSNQVLGGVN